MKCISMVAAALLVCCLPALQAAPKPHGGLPKETKEVLSDIHNLAASVSETAFLMEDRAKADHSPELQMRNLLLIRENVNRIAEAVAGGPQCDTLHLGSEGAG